MLDKIGCLLSSPKTIGVERKFSLAYKLLLLFYLTAQTIGPFHRTWIISVFLWSTLAVAVVDFLLRLTRINRFLKTPYFWLLIAFLATEAISIVVNLQYGVSQNLSHFVLLAFIICLLYANDYARPASDVWKDLMKVGKVYLGLMNIGTIISFVMMFCNYGRTIFIEDYRIKIGFVENRLWGVFRDPTHAAIFMIIAILISTYAIYSTKRKWAKAYYVISDILMLFYISFSDSRTARYAMLGCGIFFTYVLLFKFGFKKLQPILKQIIIIALAVVVGFVAYKAPVVITDSYNKVVIAIEERRDSDGEKDEDEMSRVVYRAYDLSNDPLNQRAEIWQNGIDVFKAKPITGVTFFNIKSFLRSEMPSAYIIQKGNTFSHFHNEILNVLASQGILGLVTLGAFAVLLAISVLKYYFKLQGKKYFTMSIAITALLAFCCEMLVQQGPLYNYTPSMFFFWAFLSYMAQVVRESKESTLAEKSEKFAFAVDTPLQTLNCVNFVLNDTKGSKGKADLYMYHQFKGSDELSARLKESGVFNNVYDIDVYKKYPSVLNKFVTIFRLFLPANAIRSAARQKIPMSKKSYAYIGVSFPTSFTTGLHMAYPRAQVLLIEDGIGSYFGNIVDDYATGIFKWIDKFFFGNTLSIQPTEIYLSNPQLSKNRIDSKVCRLDMVKPENLSVIEKIFDYKPNQIYKEHKAVYLTQPLDEKDGFVKENEKKIEDLLVRSFSTEVVARIHPRHNAAAFDNMCPDTFRNLWELECVKQIGDEHILIGAFSTAQFMPKLLKNVEPTIICTYPILFNNLDDAFWQGTKKFIDDFKALYSNPQKIYTPESLEALQKLLNDLGDANEM